MDGWMQIHLCQASSVKHLQAYLNTCVSVSGVDVRIHTDRYTGIHVRYVFPSACVCVCVYADPDPLSQASGSRPSTPASPASSMTSICAARSFISMLCEADETLNRELAFADRVVELYLFLS